MVHTTQFSPFNAWKRPFGAQYDGETYHATTNVPGSPSITTTYNNAQVQRFSDNTFVSTCGNIIDPGFNQNSSHWNRVSNSCDNWEYWSK